MSPSSEGNLKLSALFLLKCPCLLLAKYIKSKETLCVFPVLCLWDAAASWLLTGSAAHT